MKYLMYLSNKELYIEIIISKAQGKLTTKAIQMFEIMGKRIIKKFWYNNPDDRLDCYQGGLYDMMKNWYHFAEDKTNNPFAYYTEVFKRGAAKTYNELHPKTKDGRVNFLSIERSNDGNGLHSI